MQKAKLTVFAIALFVFAITRMAGCTSSNQPAGNSATNQTSTPVPFVSAVNPAPEHLSPVIPFDRTLGGPSIQLVQNGFDEFSWSSFVALNWPALPDGSPDTSKVIGGDGDHPTVWESYKETYEIFKPDGSEPVWDNHQLPQACQGIAGGPTNKVMQMAQKVSDEVLDETGNPFNTGPVIDRQNGRFARFEIRVNKIAFDFIVQNKLYNKEGQAAFTNFIQFPAGKAAGKDGTGASPNEGAMIFKAAWKVIDEKNGDIPGRFHTTKAYVFTPESESPPIKPSCELVTMGLVGFHIAHKTFHAPQWVWTTFEHVDNVEVGPNAPAGAKPNFFNPDCKDCKENVPPPKPWDPNQTLPPELRSQITRIIPIDDATKALNKKWQDLLRSVNPNSVWQNYQLISTQWPSEVLDPNNPIPQLQGPKAMGRPIPVYLANTALESYIQGRVNKGVPTGTSSCNACHNNAATTNGKFSDFTYILARANKSGGAK